MALVHVLILSLAIVATGAGVELWRRWHARRRIERALLNELVALRSEAVLVAMEIARRHRTGEPVDAAFFRDWRLSAPLIYPAIGAEFGWLCVEGRDRVGFFHAQLANARSLLGEARAAGGFEPSPYRILDHLMRAYGDVEPWVRRFEPRVPFYLKGRPGMEMPYWPIYMPGKPDTSEAYALLAELHERACEGGGERPVLAYWPL